MEWNVSGEGGGGCTRVMQFAFAIRLKAAFSCEELATTGKNHTREKTGIYNLFGREENRGKSQNIA